MTRALLGRDPRAKTSTACCSADGTATSAAEIVIPYRSIVWESTAGGV
ncbi:hypothetical protein ACIBCT_31630 [Streptosporangium sp. NPDC050855]